MDDESGDLAIADAIRMAAVEAQTPDQERDSFAELARPRYDGKDTAHDWDHIRRILGRVDWLSEGLPQLDLRRLRFLACFHGLATLIDDDDNFRAEVVQMLRSSGWSDSEISEGLTSLQRHGHDPQSPEEMVVHDANAVEVVGAFGIAKAFTKGGAEGQSYEDTVRIYSANLAQLRFFTPKGQEIHRERAEFARDFLDRFHNEDFGDGVRSS